MNDYKKITDEKTFDALTEVLSRLPDYCKQFINAKNYTLAIRTRLEYARDLEIFMHYIKKSNPECKSLQIKEIPFSCIEMLSPQDIDEYMAMLEDYEFNGDRYHNSSSGKRRKLAAVRELYKYFCKYGFCKSNPAILVETPKDPIKRQIRALASEEKMALYEALKDTASLTPRQEEIHKLLEIRDRAMITMFLGTGIRVSELVGLNLDDVDMTYQYISVLAKGGKYTQHFFNDEIKVTLEAYLLSCRGKFHPPQSENALFLSRRGSRIGVRNVELIVKNYSSLALGKDHAISPHKLRSTYGTDLYAATGDIALVSDNLGHADISTTKHYYAKQNIENLRKNKDFKIL